ncbi:hypothetical protein [Nannocystis radixulma]|uniref:Secreted protein n=1 Tax=Nannocystis radixulma TaxID=2995305 RepID=A0ABT5B5H8_9BACT|nr:hypothetical protein [Nannocystis radixulma]MDC0669390.1 hypothetical protein [Nannocystis radixulma]
MEFGRLWAAFTLLLAIAFAVVFTAAPADPLIERFEEPTVDVPAEQDDAAFMARQTSFDSEQTAHPQPAPKAKKETAALPSLHLPRIVVTQLTTFGGQESAAPPSKSRCIANARGPPTSES